MAKPLFTSLLGLALTASAASAATFTGYTSPSEEAKLAFPQVGRVADITVKEGDVIEKNDDVAKQDLDQEMARLEALKLDADKALMVAARVKEKEQAESDLRRILDLRPSGAATEYEEEQAVLKRDLAEIQVDLTHREGAIAAQQAQVQQKRVEDMILLSPIDGTIAAVDVNVGNVVDQDDPIVHVVKLNPLKIEVPSVSSAAAANLRTGQELEVQFPGETEWRPAKVTFISPVVNSAADTRKITLTIPNTEGRPAGLRVQVRLPEAVAQTN